MTLPQYILKLNTLFQTGNAREHSYRGDLQNLLMDILPDILVTNEPARVACGAPDYVLTKKDIPVGYIEAKDIGVDLNSKTLKEQFERYKAGLSNLIFTDYMDFHFYKDGILITKIAIAELTSDTIVAKPENFDQFAALIKNFALTVSQTIKSPTKLAQMMAGKAKLMADIIEKSLNSDDANSNRSNLKSQMLSFQQMLIHDIDNKSFADIYAQTIAYGMFAARYHDPTLPTFSRQEAATLIPKSNPFLRKLFQDIAGYDLDDRLVWIVDELVTIFLATDVSDIMKNFGRSTKQEDPVVHFYETFLASYNPALRKARGVWYTPQPVVNFIVRAVDDILKTEFGLKDGLADTSKIKIKKKDITKATADKRSKIKEVESEVEVHKVQILDPATGTGTFLAEVVRHIHKKFAGQQGIWSKYVTNDLIPRLNGFELLMASYAMAHLKMDMLLTETGYKPIDDQRFRIFLTNSLEEAHPDAGTLFSSWLSDEADQANVIKRDTPVMVVIGNPPYSVSSSNKSPWIQNLIMDYKIDLNERKINLDDDYIKFIRFGQHFIDKNKSGILAYISNNSFIDGITHRQMRKNLLESFDDIYILDLHGNSKKKESCPDGSPDQNVFDIMQGVSINVFVKTGKKQNDELATIYHSSLQGKREFKYSFLMNDFLKIKWDKLAVEKPYYFFVPKDFGSKNRYEEGFKIDELFTVLSSGIETAKDALVYSESEKELHKIIEDFSNMDSPMLSQKYHISIEKIFQVKGDIKNAIVIKSSYKVFQEKFLIWSKNSQGVIWRPRNEGVKHFLKENIGLILMRTQVDVDAFRTVFVSTSPCDKNYYGFQTYFIPLYLYNADDVNQKRIHDSHEKIPNLNLQIIKRFEKDLNHVFFHSENTVCDLAEGSAGHFSPLDVLDYIYAVLNSPSYREKYKDFLKIDFPRVPFPTDADSFWKLVQLGGKLRQLHLLESETVGQYISQFNIDGDNIVTKPKFVDGKVYINDTQYFDNVPDAVWNFYIGGYQPAQKWLKDRKDRELSVEDVRHYLSMVVALWETGRLMGEIDKVKFINEN